MQENLAMPVTLEALAQAAGTSRFHLLRLFRRAYGETPLKRPAQLRMEEAQRQLRQGIEPVTRIAFLCGYENPSHFATAFRRVVGVLPKAHRAGR
jgi:AraC family transcriptional regulator